MYKTKLREWGLSKYIRATEAVAIIKAMEERLAAGKSSQVVLRGEKVDMDRIKNYVRRNRNRGRLERMLIEEKKAASEDVKRELVCRTPSPSPDLRSPTPGGPLGPAEDLYRSIFVYVDGSFAARTWFIGMDGAMRSLTGDPDLYQVNFKDLWNRVDMASQLIGKVERLDLVKLLDPAFAYMVNVVQDLYPRSIPFMLSAFESLYDRGRSDLVNMFLKQIVGLSEVILGREHPHTRIWQQLQTIYTDEHVEIMERLFLLLLNQLRQQKQRSDHLEIAVYNDYCDCILIKRDLETQERSMRREVERIQARRVKNFQVSLLVLRHATAVKDLALQQKRYADAAVSMDILRDYGDWDGAHGLQARAEAALASGDFLAAESFYREATEHIDINPQFKDESWANQMLTKLEGLLIRNGKEDEAKKVAQAKLDRIARLEVEFSR